MSINYGNGMSVDYSNGMGRDYGHMRRSKKDMAVITLTT
jgi:hypothetical protein